MVFKFFLYISHFTSSWIYKCDWIHILLKNFCKNTSHIIDILYTFYYITLENTSCPPTLETLRLLGPDVVIVICPL